MGFDKNKVAKNPVGYNDVASKNYRKALSDFESTYDESKKHSDNLAVKDREIKYYQDILDKNQDASSNEYSNLYYGACAANSWRAYFDGDKENLEVFKNFILNIK